MDSFLRLFSWICLNAVKRLYIRRITDLLRGRFTSSNTGVTDPITNCLTENLSQSLADVPSVYKAKGGYYHNLWFACLLILSTFNLSFLAVFGILLGIEFLRFIEKYKTKV